MITANDYQRGLFNGDQGIIVRADEGAPVRPRHHRYRAVFRVGTQLVPFAIEALRDRLELAWALTVHKSQGSELDAVAIVLPGRRPAAGHARAAVHRDHARAVLGRAVWLANRDHPRRGPRSRSVTAAWPAGSAPPSRRDRARTVTRLAP